MLQKPDSYSYHFPTDEVLFNPHIGFQTFQRFNGDELNPVEDRKWTEGFPIRYQEYKGSLENKQFPHTTVAYYRVYWRYFEPEEGKYNWDLIEKALQTAKERGQTLMLRLPPYGLRSLDDKDKETDIPDWLRKYVGPLEPIPTEKYGNKQYLKESVLDTSNPAYAHYYSRAIEMLAKRYDMDPRLDSVDMGIVGPWGEDDGIEDFNIKSRNQIIHAYLDHFQNTPIMSQSSTEDVLRYINGIKGNVGLRADCLGDMSRRDALDGWRGAHMLIAYPFFFGLEGIRDMWRTGPVSFEACGVMQTWLDFFGPQCIDTIIDQSLAWHISTFNAKSSPIPLEWMPKVDRWLKSMGYRYALRTAHFPSAAHAGDEIEVHLWMENKGVAPIYRKYPFVIRIKSASTQIVIDTPVDIRKWMPGDSIVDLVLALPKDTPHGEYEMQLAILDPLARTPNIRFACDAHCDEGYYAFGKLRIE